MELPMNKRTDAPDAQRGVALLVALVSVLVLSTLVAGVVFATQTQVWTSYNYRVTTQARYAAEAGIQRTMNWMINNYTPPSDFAPYLLTRVPVQSTANNLPVRLSALTDTTANYPIASVQTAYWTELGNRPVPGIPNATFSTSATLLRLSPATGVSWLPNSSAGGPQTWLITSVGRVRAQGNVLGDATVQVQATYERSGTPVFTHAAQTTGTGCNVLTISSSGYIDSFDSAVGVYADSRLDTGADVASNGNIRLTGSAQIKGDVSVLNTNVGICLGLGFTLLSSAVPPVLSASALVSPLNPDNPLAPSPTPPTNNQNISGSCGAIAGCTQVGSVITLSPGVGYGNLQVSSGSTVHLTAGTYNINSLTLSGGSQLVLDSAPVVVNIAGGAGASHAIDFSGGSIGNANGVAADLALVYGGTLPITLSGGSENHAVLYAPNSGVTLNGPSSWYGSIVSETYASTGGGALHYDRALQRSLQKTGPFTPVNFSWNSF
jgi:Tfp pilus assembly protein PilX